MLEQGFNIEQLGFWPLGSGYRIIMCGWGGIGRHTLVVASDYVLNTLLKDMTGREVGVRNEREAGIGEQQTIKGYLQRGCELVK